MRSHGADESVTAVRSAQGDHRLAHGLVADIGFHDRGAFITKIRFLRLHQLSDGHRFMGKGDCDDDGHPLGMGVRMSGERVTERAMVEPGQLVMPFYLVCDVSGSMAHNIAELNDGIRRLWRAVVSEPVVDDVSRIGILTFSDSAKVVLPLSQMSWNDVPALSAEGGTNYGAAFRLLAQTIADDAACLKAQGYKIYRPCVFFLTDGEPSDPDWDRTFRDTLTYDAATGRGMRAHPVFVPFGFRNASEHVLRRLAYPLGKGKWYHSKSHNVEVALRGILDVIMNSVVGSGMSVSTGQPTLFVRGPAPDSGISSGDPDVWV